MDNQKKQGQLREIIGECTSANLITFGPEGYPRGRLMGDQNVGEDWVFWYATYASSRKIGEIAANPNVTLFYERKRDQAFACVMGKAQVCTDQETKDKYWNDEWRMYWPDGPTSADYCIIKVRPDFAELWDLETHELRTIEF